MGAFKIVFEAGIGNSVTGYNAGVRPNMGTGPSSWGNCVVPAIEHPRPWK